MKELRRESLEGDVNSQSMQSQLSNKPGTLLSVPFPVPSIALLVFLLRQTPPLLLSVDDTGYLPEPDFVLIPQFQSILALDDFKK